MSLSRRRYLALVISALVIGAPPMLATAAESASVTRDSAAGDPLFRYQSHLSNQGQAVIGDSRPVPGVDMDVDILHSLGIRGRGVRVAVVDDGLELRHADLAANIIPNGSHNFETGSNDTTPTNPLRAHGTAVAGIVAAVGWNGRGGRGVAPDALLAGFDFLGRPSSTTLASVRYAWGDGPEARTIDIFNNSWGLNTPMYEDFPAAEQRAWEA